MLHKSFQDTASLLYIPENHSFTTIVERFFSSPPLAEPVRNQRYRCDRQGDGSQYGEGPGHIQLLVHLVRKHWRQSTEDRSKQYVGSSGGRRMYRIRIDDVCAREELFSVRLIPVLSQIAVLTIELIVPAPKTVAPDRGTAQWISL